MAKKTLTQDGSHSGKKTRSKLGCRNCKLRGVKCDESSPECKRCLQYGVVCSYISKLSAGDDLQVSVQQEVVMNLDRQMSQVQVYQKPTLLIPQYIPYWTSRNDELLNKFQLVTAQTVSVGPRTRLYCTAVVERARSYPFMLNALMGLTSMHLRSISAGLKARPSVEEAEFCYKAVSQFAKEVVSPRNAEHQGMLLCASYIMGNMTFANIDAKSPEEAWPLSPPCPSDLGWLKISEAKQRVASLATPIGSDPLYAVLQSSFAPEIAARKSVSEEPAALPLGFSSLFGIDTSSKLKENPYLIPATRLAGVFNSKDTIVVTIGWITMVSDLTTEFKQLLYRKDPRALLLLACWFAKLSFQPVWWYRHRAILEGQAICLYLDRFHPDELNIQVLLRYPKGVFGQLPEWELYPMSLEDYFSNPRYSRSNTTTSTPSFTGLNSSVLSWSSVG